MCNRDSALSLQQGSWDDKDGKGKGLGHVLLIHKHGTGKTGQHHRAITSSLPSHLEIVPKHMIFWW